MKKSAALFMALFVSTASLSAAPGISLGANVGSSIQQEIRDEEKMITGLPQLGIAVDAQFEKFGLEADLGVIWESINSYQNSQKTKESGAGQIISLTPYVPFRTGNFTFTIGPTFGFYFIQFYYEVPSLDLEIEARAFLFLMGGTFGLRYSLSDRLSLFFNIPVFSAPYQKITDAKNNQSSAVTLPEGSWSSSNLFAIPNIGLAFKF